LEESQVLHWLCVRGWTREEEASQREDENQRPNGDERRAAFSALQLRGAGQFLFSGA
jgi:hypothetical protein